MERYGKETILSSFEELFALTEAKVRAEIASWPDGVGEGERFVDSDGIELDKPVRLHVRMEKKGDRLLFDFTGSRRSNQRAGEYSPDHRARGLLLSAHLSGRPGAGDQLRISQVHRHQSARRQRRQSALSGAGEHLQSDRPRPGESLLEASSQITPHKKVGDGCSSRSIIIGGRSNKTGKGYVHMKSSAAAPAGEAAKTACPAPTSISPTPRSRPSKSSSRNLPPG